VWAWHAGLHFFLALKTWATIFAAMPGATVLGGLWSTVLGGLWALEYFYSSIKTVHSGRFMGVRVGSSKL